MTVVENETEDQVRAELIVAEETVRENEVEGRGAGTSLPSASAAEEQPQKLGRPWDNDSGDWRGHRALPFIVESILKVARPGAKKSIIKSKARLSNHQVNHYLEYCQAADLISVREDVEDSRYYFTSIKGLKYLELIGSLRSLANLDEW
ncbi:MAG TPA: winged helix-turn-helix domain-containing protein [Nitrososphaerales archaeon]|nr:winged helix-turn-helix domain-containing protein [Nitrososphaerales archaeon]